MSIIFLYNRRPSIICSVRVARPTHLQNINPESGKSEKCRNNFLIAKHFFESSFASSFCLLYPHWVPFMFFSCTHIEIFKSKSPVDRLDLKMLNDADRTYFWWSPYRVSKKLWSGVWLYHATWFKVSKMMVDLLLFEIICHQSKLWVAGF